MSLRDLGGEVPPPAHLKARVVQDLRARGLLRPARRAWLRLAAAVAGLGLFGAGYFVAGLGGEPPGAPLYALFLYEDGAFDRSQPESALVAEYGGWAGQLARAGQLVSGEKLGATVVVEPPPGPDGPGELAGFFILAAPNDSAALALARGTPHLRHRGRIALRRIDPT